MAQSHEEMKTLVIGPNDNPPRLGRYSSGLDRVAQEHANKPDHWLLTAEGDIEGMEDEGISSATG